MNVRIKQIHRGSIGIPIPIDEIEHVGIDHGIVMDGMKTIRRCIKPHGTIDVDKLRFPIILTDPPFM